MTVSRRIWPALRRKGSDHGCERRRQNQEAEPRPTQEGRGPRRRADCRGDDIVRTAARTQAHAGPHGQKNWASPRPASRAWRSAATCCFPRCARRSKRWVETCRWWPNSRTGPRSFLRVSRRTVRALKSKSHDRAPRENHQRVRECFDAPPLAEASRPAPGIAGLPGQDLLCERLHTSRGFAGPDSSENCHSGV